MTESLGCSQLLIQVLSTNLELITILVQLLQNVQILCLKKSLFLCGACDVLHRMVPLQVALSLLTVPTSLSTVRNSLGMSL